MHVAVAVSFPKSQSMAPEVLILLLLALLMPRQWLFLNRPLPGSFDGTETHTMNFLNLALAAAHFHELKHDMDEIGPEVIKRACIMVWTEARRVLGTEGYAWPALSPETLAHKMMPGMLKETGELHDSIEWTAEGNEGHVGSNSDKAVIHELGTSKIPARTFLVGAAMAMEPAIHAMAAKAAMAVASGGSLYGSEMHELIHLLKHAAHEFKELAHQTLEGDDPEGILR